MHLVLNRWFKKKKVSVNFGRAWWDNKLQAANTWCWGCHALPHKVSKATGGGVVPQATDTWRRGCMPWVLVPNPRA